MTPKHDSVETCDFRKPRRLAARPRRTLESWITNGCTFAVERWRRLNLDVELTHASIQTLLPGSALASLADPGWGMLAGIGVNSFTSLITSRPGWLRLMVGQLLGEETASDGTDTPLTAIEESMAELLLQEFVAAFGDAWPGIEPLPIRLEEAIHRPRRVRVYKSQTTLTVVSFQVGSSAGNDRLVWLMPQQEIEDLIDIECTPPEAPRVVPSPDISRLIRTMTVPMTIELGSVSLSMTELASLQMGDVVVLDQPSFLPIRARVGGTITFQGRPGKIGTHRCLEIAEVVRDDPSTRVHDPRP